MNPIRRLLPFLLVFMPLFAAAQRLPHTVYFSKDSITRALNSRADWRIYTIDIPNGADTALDDSAWPLVNSELRVYKDTAPGGFRGFAWLRLHLWADTSVVNKPLALRITHYGASEVYVDGRMAESFGTVAPADSIVAYDPQSVPIVIHLSAPGPHVLAVRYANKAWLHNYKVYGKEFTGIRIGIGEANERINEASRTTSLLTGIMMMLAGIFWALALMHFILFLYYRTDRSNLLFSLFALCMGTSLFLPVINVLSHDPVLLLHSQQMLLITFPATFCFLSALVSMLFSRRRWELWAITIMAILTTIIALLNRDAGSFAIAILVIAVLLHVFINVIIAMWRRMPGARILGVGILLFVALLLFIIVFGSFNKGLYFNDTTTAGQLIEIGIMLCLLAIPASMSAFLAWRFARINKRLTLQLAEVQRLSEAARNHESEKQQMLEMRQEELERKVAIRTEELRSQKQKSDDLLLNILPSEIAEELKETGASAARLYNNVSVLFTDFVDFTQMSESLSPAQLVAEIDTCFKAFDGIIGAHNLEKIKTVGDAYIAVSGLPAENAAHAQDVVRAALEICDFMVARKSVHPDTFRIRLGVHSGPVVAGIVGVKKFAYDIWGDTVNTAARMEQHSEAGKLNISAATFELVKNDFATEYRGELEAKHKGKMGMYFVDRLG